MNKEQLHNFILHSTGNESNICQIYAIKDGKTVFDDCWHGFKTDDAMNVNSVTKGIMALLAGIALDMGCIKSVDQKVLDFLKKEDEHPTRQPAMLFWSGDNIRQRRVAVLFNHGDQEAAWALAQGSEMREEWWLKLAEWRSKAMPEKSASLLRQLLERALRPTGEDAYRHVIDLLKIYRKYLKMDGKEADFMEYCKSLRVEYKRRRLLMEQMNAAKL